MFGWSLSCNVTLTQNSAKQKKEFRGISRVREKFSSLAL